MRAMSEPHPNPCIFVRLNKKITEVKMFPECFSHAFESFLIDFETIVTAKHL
jgi:hypothetical protein